MKLSDSCLGEGLENGLSSGKRLRSTSQGDISIIFHGLQAPASAHTFKPQ